MERESPFAGPRAVKRLSGREAARKARVRGRRRFGWLGALPKMMPLKWPER